MKEFKIYKVAYNPPFSDKVVETVKEEFQPAMFDEKGEWGQYDLNIVDRVIERIDVTEEDKKLYEHLVEQDVAYIEI